MSDILDRLKGNGEPWTFREIIEEIERLRKATELKSTAEEECMRAIDHVGQYNSGSRITEAKGWVRNAFADIDDHEREND